MWVGSGGGSGGWAFAFDTRCLRFESNGHFSANCSSENTTNKEIGGRYRAIFKKQKSAMKAQMNNWTKERETDVGNWRRRKPSSDRNNNKREKNWMKRGRKIKQSQMCLIKEGEEGMKKWQQKARKTGSVKRTIKRTIKRTRKEEEEEVKDWIEKNKIEETNFA